MSEGPYKLPEGWRWVRLGEVCRTKSGNSKLIKGRLHKTLAPGRYKGFSASGQDVWLDHFEFEGEAIILSAVGARCGKCFMASGKWTAIANTHIVWPETDKADIRYLYYLVNNEAFWVRGQSAQPFVKVRESKQKLIPLPPLPEQRRIVARVEELMTRVREARRLREEAHTEAERLWQSVLADTFPRPGSNLPEGWRWVRLGEVCEIIMGQSPPSSTYNTEEEGLPFFQGKADFGDLHPTPRVWCRAPQKIAEVGDILISVRAPVGPTNLAREKCCIGRGLAALGPNGLVETMWLLYYLRSVENELGTRGTGSTFNAITKRQLENLEIPLPPLAEQRRNVAHLEAVHEKLKALREAQEATEGELKRLEQAILDTAFRAEL